MSLYKKDDNHDSIKEAFLKIGFDWIDTHWSRGLLLDGMAILKGKVRFIEIKNGPKYKLTTMEQDFISKYSKHCNVVWCHSQVVDIYNTI